MSDPLHTDEFLAGYVAEAQDHLATARRALLQAEDALRRGQVAVAGRLEPDDFRRRAQRGQRVAQVVVDGGQRSHFPHGGANPMK